MQQGRKTHICTRKRSSMQRLKAMMELILYLSLCCCLAICFIREISCLSLQSTSHYGGSGLVHTLVCSWNQSENGLPSAASTIFWQKGNESQWTYSFDRRSCVLSNNTGRQIEWESGYLYQTITLPARNASGVWTCSVDGTESNSVTLPAYHPSKLHMDIDKIISFPGDEITFSCTLENGSVDYSSWYTNKTFDKLFTISSENWMIVPGVSNDTRNLFNRTSSNNSSSALNVTLVELSLEDNELNLQCNVGNNYSNHVEVIVLAPPDLPENITLRETTGVYLDNLTVTLTCTSTCYASGHFKFTWDTDLEGNTTETSLNSYGCYNTCSQNVTIRMDSGQKKEVSCTVTNLKTGKNLTAQYDLHRIHGGGGISSEDEDNLKSIWFTVGIVGILAAAVIVLVVLKGRNSWRRDETVYIESHEYASCNDEMVTTEEYLSTRGESRSTKAVMRNSKYVLKKTPQVVSDEENTPGATTNEYFCLEDNDKAVNDALTTTIE